jgi:hypothetical protein
MGLVEEKVRDGRLVREGLFQREPLARLWAEHKTGRANHYQFLWQLINLEIWIEEYFGHAPIS